MQAEERGHQRGVGVLHVLRAAAVEVAVLLDELKRIGMPVGAQRLDHVDVAEKEDGLFLRGLGGANADDQVLLVRVGAEQLHVFGRKAGIEEALLHGLGAGGHAALRSVGGVDLDELLENVAGFGAVAARGRGDAGLGARCNCAVRKGRRMRQREKTRTALEHERIV